MTSSSVKLHEWSHFYLSVLRLKNIDVRLKKLSDRRPFMPLKAHFMGRMKMWRVQGAAFNKAIVFFFFFKSFFCFFSAGATVSIPLKGPYFKAVA